MRCRGGRETPHAGKRVESFDRRCGKSTAAGPGAGCGSAAARCWGARRRAFELSIRSDAAPAPANPPHLAARVSFPREESPAARLGEGRRVKNGTASNRRGPDKAPDVTSDRRTRTGLACCPRESGSQGRARHRESLRARTGPAPESLSWTCAMVDNPILSQQPALEDLRPILPCLGG